MRFIRRLRFLIGQRELAEEMRVHQQMRRADGLGEGDFGNDLLLRERSRDAWGWLWLAALDRDVRYALRMFRRAPGFAIVAVLSLAIGIGACTAVYSLVDAVFLRPLPVAHPERLFTVYWAAHRWRPNSSDSTAGFQLPDGRKADSTFSYPMWRQWQQDARSVLTLAGFQNFSRLDLAQPGGTAERVEGMMVSGNFDAVVGLKPALGRGINPSDNRAGAPLVAEISYAYWHARLDGRRDVLGKTLLVNGLPAQIVGVAPRGFVGLLPANQPAVYLPLRALTADLGARLWGFTAKFSDPTEFCIEMVGRLRAGVTRNEAQAALAVPFARALATMRQHPRAGFDKPAILVASARNGIDANFINIEPVFWMLGALVALVLLIALATLANLLIARTAARRNELSLRAAIGAGRAVLVRQMTTECLVLAVLGGLAAIPVAVLLQQSLQATKLSVLPFRMNLSALAVAAFLAIAAGVVLGLTAAWRATRLPASGLRELHASPLSGRRTTRILLGAEVAVCLLVLACAGLFLRTVHNLEAVNTGFDASDLLLFTVA
ncbi:MAG: ABC transporter permease, partial [Terriglobales bacterium]